MIHVLSVIVLCPSEAILQLSRKKARQPTVNRRGAKIKFDGVGTNRRVNAGISICKFIGIPWHPFLYSTPPRAARARILEKENYRNYITSRLIKRNPVIRLN